MPPWLTLLVIPFYEELTEKRPQCFYVSGIATKAKLLEKQKEFPHLTKTLFKIFIDDRLLEKMLFMGALDDMMHNVIKRVSTLKIT